MLSSAAAMVEQLIARATRQEGTAPRPPASFVAVACWHRLPYPASAPVDSAVLPTPASDCTCLPSLQNSEIAQLPPRRWRLTGSGSSLRRRSSALPAGHRWGSACPCHRDPGRWRRLGWPSPARESHPGWSQAHPPLFVAEFGPTPPSPIPSWAPVVGNRSLPSGPLLVYMYDGCFWCSRHTPACLNLFLPPMAAVRFPSKRNRRKKEKMGILVA
jgi:hypothetical protein